MTDAPLADAFAFGPVDGLNEPHSEGSYVRLRVDKQVVRISRGAAEVLAAELLGAIGKLLEYRDAARYRHLRDHHYWRHPMTPDNPMECGISYEFQQSKPGESTLSLDALMDRDIERVKQEESAA
jgi:hypothetical protein